MNTNQYIDEKNHRGIRAFDKLLWDVAAWHEPARLLGDDGGADSLAVGDL